MSISKLGFRFKDSFEAVTPPGAPPPLYGGHGVSDSEGSRTIGRDASQSSP
jgi:hypothetical protein